MIFNVSCVVGISGLSFGVVQDIHRILTIIPANPQARPGIRRAGEPRRTFSRTEPYLLPSAHVYSSASQGALLLLAFLGVKTWKSSSFSSRSSPRRSRRRPPCLVVTFGSLEAFLKLLWIVVTPGATHGERKAIWRRFGMWLLLGLEFALAADIIGSVMSPTWQDIGELGAIAVIRTFLNYFLERDLESAEKSGERSRCRSFQGQGANLEQSFPVKINAARAARLCLTDLRRCPSPARAGSPRRE